MFRIYSEHQNGKFYLSPYTDIMIDNDKLLIRQTLFNCIIKINCKPAWAQELLELLYMGVGEQVLLAYFKQNMSAEEAQKTVNNWLRMGGLE